MKFGIFKQVVKGFRWEDELVMYVNSRLVGEMACTVAAMSLPHTVISLRDSEGHRISAYYHRVDDGMIEL